MRYKLLGHSGLKVSELALGTMTFGESWGFGASPEECRRIFDAYIALGGNLIDTANKYTDGAAEQIVGDLIHDNRERLVLATKYTMTMRGGDPNASGNHRKNMVQSLEASLNRLGTDYVDILWVHAWDGITPIDETMRALDDLVRSGKVLYVGMSDAPAWIVAQANTLAELRGWSRFIGLQLNYNLTERSAERELLPMARALGIGVTAWGALAAGILTGKYSRRPQVEDSLRARMNGHRLSERNVLIARAVDAIADKLDRSSTQVALNWVRQRGKDIVPIIGARKQSQIEDALRCIEFTIPDEDMEHLDEVSRIEMGFPHDFLASDPIQEVLFGDTRGRLER